MSLIFGDLRVLDLMPVAMMTMACGVAFYRTSINDRADHRRHK